MKSEAVLVRQLVIVAFLGLVFFNGCGGGTSQPLTPPPAVNSQSIPQPTISTISPTNALAGGAAFTLTITGTNFVSVSVVNFGGTQPTITAFTATQLTATIPAAVIASVGTVAVTVTNPSSSAGTSNAVSFSVTSGPSPVPTINSLGPSAAPMGEQALTLSISGANFVAGSVVRWNGSDRPTTVRTAQVLDALIPASDIASAGTATITVFNPAPGGGSSNTLTFTIATGGVCPNSVAVAPAGKFAYVANSGCGDFVGNVSVYTINPTTGALTSIGSPIAADSCANSIAVDPSGKFAYVANWGCADFVGNVSVYTINATTGALTSIGAIAAGAAPTSIAIDPSGKFAYVANESDFAPTTVSMYSINSTTGALSSIGLITSGGRATSVTVDPTGKFVYVTDVSNGFPGENGDVSMYTINAATGVLTSIGTIPEGSHPTSIAIDPSGKFAYVTNPSSNNILMYTINATTGALTSIGQMAAPGPGYMAVDPTGKFAYVTGSNDVLMYAIDATTGVLSSTGTIAAGVSPTSIAIDPSGKFAYVTNSDSDNVSMYSIDAASGALTLIGTVGT